MILAVILLAGCALWALGEAIMLTGDQITVLGGTIATIGMILAGCGIWTLKDLPGMARPGRVGIALSAFGAFSFAMVMIIVLTSGVLGAMADGAVHHADIVFTPFYLLALVPAGLAAGHLVRLFAADVPAYHETLSVALALYLGWLGVRRVALARSVAQPSRGV